MKTKSEQREEKRQKAKKFKVSGAKVKQLAKIIEEKNKK